MLVLGAGVFPRTFRAPKSVCVSSVEGGPLSRVWGFDEERKEAVEERCRGEGKGGREAEWGRMRYEM